MGKQKELTDAGVVILSLLKKNEYVTSFTLKMKLHMSDREVRSELELVKQQYPVCNFMDGKGFFLAKTKEEAKKQREQEIGRAKKIMYNTRGLKMFIDKRGG